VIYHLFRKTRKAKARKAYAEAKARHDDAVKRRDTRSIHEAAKLLGDAMTELLKAESVKVIR